jgi:hypothetical protein
LKLGKTATETREMLEPVCENEAVFFYACLQPVKDLERDVTNRNMMQALVRHQLLDIQIHKSVLTGGKIPSGDP